MLSSGYPVDIRIGILSLLCVSFPSEKLVVSIDIGLGSHISDTRTLLREYRACRFFSEGTYCRRTQRPTPSPTVAIWGDFGHLLSL